jgi:hypothetical protein
MMIYTQVRFKPKKKRKPKGIVARKLNVSRLEKFNTLKIPNYASASLRVGADAASSLPSLVSTTQFIPSRTGMMDPAKLAKESPEVRDAIIAKSKRLAPAYNKGAVQYITDDADIQTLGRKIK